MTANILPLGHSCECLCECLIIQVQEHRRSPMFHLLNRTTHVVAAFTRTAHPNNLTLNTKLPCVRRSAIHTQYVCMKYEEVWSRADDRLSTKSNKTGMQTYWDARSNYSWIHNINKLLMHRWDFHLWSSSYHSSIRIPPSLPPSASPSRSHSISHTPLLLFSRASVYSALLDASPGHLTITPRRGSA